MNRLFSHERKDAVIRHVKALAAIAAFFLAVIGGVSFWHSESWRAQHLELIVINGSYLAFVTHLLWVILNRPAPEYLGKPKVRKVLINERLLLVEQSPWLSVGVMTSTFVMEDDMERLVGVGEVVNVQANGLVQVSVQSHQRGYENDTDVWNALNRVERNSILVRPGLAERSI